MIIFVGYLLLHGNIDRNDYVCLHDSFVNLNRMQRHGKITGMNDKSRSSKSMIRLILFCFILATKHNMSWVLYYETLEEYRENALKWKHFYEWRIFLAHKMKWRYITKLISRNQRYLILKIVEQNNCANRASFWVISLWFIRILLIGSYLDMKYP